MLPRSLVSGTMNWSHMSLMPVEEGSAIAVHQSWKVNAILPVDVRILCVICSNVGEQKVCITSAHFDTSSKHRKEQWRILFIAMAQLPDVTHIPLDDHDSTIHPTYDCAVPPPPKPKDSQVLKARVAEHLASEHLVQLMSGHMDPLGPPIPHCAERVHLAGMCRGHRPNQNAPPLRRLDRIQVPKRMVDSVSIIFTTYLGRYDHKAVILEMHPPFSTPNKSRKSYLTSASQPLPWDTLRQSEL